MTHTDQEIMHFDPEMLFSPEDPPEVKKTSPDLPIAGAAIGDRVTLFVETDAHPHPSAFMWQKVTNGSAETIPSSEVEITSTDLSSTLTIESITLEQFGEYMLTATNNQGETHFTFEIIPQGRQCLVLSSNPSTVHF